jgi:hypothetical protein
MTALTTLIVVGNLMLAGPADAGARDELVAIAEQLNKAYVLNDIPAIEQLTADNVITIMRDIQTFNWADLLKLMPKLNTTSYKTKQTTARLLTDTVAQISYIADVEGTFDGNPLASPVRVLATWTKQDGTWKQSTYQETALEKTASRRRSK